MAGRRSRRSAVARNGRRRAANLTSFFARYSKRHPPERRSTRAPRRYLFLGRNSAFESLEPRWALAASVVINEFLAHNASGIVDQDSDHSDWIELKNTSASAVNLDGWYLTNDASNPTKWQLPSVSLAAGAYLTIFASGKDRHVAGQELHTNFTIDENGGYLALDMPDHSVAYAFNPYPAQLDDVSYGLGASPVTSESPVDEDAPVRVKVPTTSADDATWRNIGFDDSSWTSGTVGVGYDDNTASTDYTPYIATNIGGLMKKTSGSGPGYAAYLRLPFLESNVDQLTSLQLQIRYDDGFVAYLNGTEIAPQRPCWNANIYVLGVDNAS